MRNNNAFKLYNRNKFYTSILANTRDLGFEPKYLPNDNDRTNFGNKLDWENKTKEIEFLLRKNGLEVPFRDSKWNPILVDVPEIPERPVGSPPKYKTKKEKIYKTKKILKSKNDASLYTNIKNYYESNNRFSYFYKKRIVRNPTNYEIIEHFFTDLYLNIQLLSQKNLSSTINTIVDLNIDILSKKNKIYLTFSELDLNLYVESIRECVIKGGSPNTNNFGYMLLGGNANTPNQATLDQWCQVNQNTTY